MNGSHGLLLPETNTLLSPTTWSVHKGDSRTNGARTPAAPEPKAYGMVQGRIIALTEAGEPLVLLQAGSDSGPVSAQTLVAVGPEAVGQSAAIMFLNGNTQKPVIMGLLREAGVVQEPSPVRIELDGEKLVFSADREIILKCGEASITLTRAGKVLIRGTYVLSRSSGVNRIKGGSVQIN